MYWPEAERNRVFGVGTSERAEKKKTTKGVADWSFRSLLHHDLLA